MALAAKLGRLTLLSANTSCAACGTPSETTVFTLCQAMGNEGRITDGGLSSSEQQVKEAGEVKGDGCGGL